MIPEAGLHRDGEQARLVNLVRKRQFQKQQHDYEEMSTMEWINDSIWHFWESVVGPSEVVQHGNKAKFDVHEHYSDIVNPYRDPKERRVKVGESAKDEKLNGMKAMNNLQQEHSSYDTTTLQSRPRLLHIMIYICQRILYMLRWAVDLAITPRSTRSDRSYFQSPSYTLHFTADDVIICTILLWVGMWFGCLLQRVTAPVVIVVLLVGVMFRRKISGQAAQANHATSGSIHQRIQFQQEGHTTIRQNQSIKETTAVKSNLLHSSVTRSNPQQLQAIEHLKRRFPNATPAECKRFYVCVKHKEEDAAQRIESWLQWRSDCGLKMAVDIDNIQALRDVAREYNNKFIKNDAEIWNAAAKLAMEIDSKGGDIDTSVKLPQILCAYESQLHANSTTEILSSSRNSHPPPRAKDHSRILHILPARIDITLCPAPTYSLACALYLDRLLCRTTTEKITLLCDVRGGRGWANPTPWSMLPFIQHTSSLLGKHYPERLEKFILFPMPSAAAWIWSAAQKCLDPNTASKVVVVGDEKGKNGLPDKMLDFFDEDCLELVEERRKLFFGPKTS